MKKTLISVDNLEEHLCAACGGLHADGALLTPGARDELARRGVSVVYRDGAQGGACCKGADRAACANAPGASGNPAFAAPDAQGGAVSVQDMLVGVAALIKRECGVTDPDQLRDMSINILKTLQKHIR
jgi:hypothetical protein